MRGRVASASNSSSCRGRPPAAAAGAAAAAARPQRARCTPPRRRPRLVVRAAPFDGGDSNGNGSGSDSSGGWPGVPASSPASGSGATTPGSGAPLVPLPLTPAAARRLRAQLEQLAPRPAGRTLLAPVVDVLLPLLQPHLRALPPPALLALLRLINYATAGHSPGAAWVAQWAAALRDHQPALSAQVAAQLVSEVLQLRQHALPEGLLDDLFVAALKDVDSCSSGSIAAALQAAAIAELSSSCDDATAAAAAGGDGLAAKHPGPPAAALAGGPAAAQPAPQPAASAAPSSRPAPEPAADTDGSSGRPASFASLMQQGGSEGADAAAAARSDGDRKPAVGPLSSWQELAAAAAADSGPDAAAAAAAQQRACAGEAAAAGAAAARQQQHKQQRGGGGQLSSGAAANIRLAAWRAGTSGGDRTTPELSSASQLHPIVLHCWLVELSKPERLAQLQPQQLATLAAAAAALQVRLPASWLDSLFAALQQRLPRLPGPALTVLTSSLPQLMPQGGSLRLWRQLGAGVAAQRVEQLSAEQLCELLPLVQAADLPLPTEWLEQALSKIQAALPDELSLPQSSRALVAAVALGSKPDAAWVERYMARFKASLSELEPVEGLVDVLRALAAADALPSFSWLQEFERDLERRFGFVGPVELSTSAFLLANLGHIPSETWRRRWLAESLKFRVYYTGADLSHVVWSAVRLATKPDAAWLQAFVLQLQEQAATLQPYQLAFCFASLQKMGASMSPGFVDGVLDAFAARLPEASASDTALLLVTVARLQHVSSYSWLQRVLDHVLSSMLAYDGQELATLLWSLAELHHQPDQEWLSAWFEACEPQLPGMSGGLLAQLGNALAQLNCQPPPAWREAYLAQCEVRLQSDGIGGRDAASLLASLATLQHTPSEQWLHSCLSLIAWRLRELDPVELASVPCSLVKLGVMIRQGPWLENYISMCSARLAAMPPATRCNLLSALAVWRAPVPRAWLAAFQLLCVQHAEEGAMTPEQLEQVVVALSALGTSPSTALAQLYFDASLPRLRDAPAEASAERLSGVLSALADVMFAPDVAWLEAAVAAVRGSLGEYDRLQLSGVARALRVFQAAGGSAVGKQPWLRDFISYLSEFT